MSETRSTPAALPTPASLALGNALKQLRLSHPTDSDKPLTQATLASLILVGGKGVVSLYESGKRLPDSATLDRYIRFMAADADHLRELHTLACTGNRALDPEPIDLPAVDSVRTRGSGTRRWAAAVVGSAIAVVLATVGLADLVRPDQSESAEASHSFVKVTFPTDTVGLTTPVSGTVTGLSGYELWLSVQSIGDSRYHPTEVPCIRHGSKFSFDPLYVGRPEDVGVTFKILVLATTRGSNGDAALYSYGRRSKTVAGAYDGLTALPDGVSVVATIFVDRQ